MWPGPQNDSDHSTYTMIEPPSSPPAPNSLPPKRSRLGIPLLGATLSVIGIAAVALFVLRDDEQEVSAVGLDLGAIVAANSEPEGTVNLRLSPAQEGENRAKQS
ncbi:hypothetical protein BH23CHL4_BH23CHL4_15120 [soil metagenome]